MTVSIALAKSGTAYSNRTTPPKNSKPSFLHIHQITALKTHFEGEEPPKARQRLFK